MATADQIARKMQQAHLDLIEEQLATLDKALRKYEPLLEQKRRLEGARRALLSERSPTAGGGRGLTQEEIVKTMEGFNGGATVHEIASKLSATEGQVRAHLNRGLNERFAQSRDDGKVLWFVRNPEADDEDEEDDD